MPIIRPPAPDLVLTRQVGTAVRLDVTSFDIDGAAVDPSTMAATVQDPDGTKTNPTPVNEAGTGAWSVTFTLESPGRWYCLLQATNPDAGLVVAVDVPDPGVTAPY